MDMISGIDGPFLYEARDGTIELLPTVAVSGSGGTRIGIVISRSVDGFAILSFTHADSRQIKQLEVLLKSICSQISIAVSNIMANEKVIRQLVEIGRYKQQLEEESIYLKEEIKVNQNYSEIIGDSQAILKTFRLVAQVASSDSTVLILGETGTGKELIARAIHNNSPRKNKLMVKVNCAALPANLIESELFGHERGSFTGATERRVGKFELANNGTLFLDEIGEMPPELQVKLLRALQEKEIERVGGKGTIKVDVRIIAATNRDLEKEVDEGRFRSDLYYRLNIFPIQLAALRDRKEDIPILTTHFIQLYSKKTGRQITTLGTRALQQMMQYSWPGNIRELEHLIERSILLATGTTLKHIHLPPNKIVTGGGEAPAEHALKTIDENECDHILKILKYCHGKISGSDGAAAILGVPVSTLTSKMKRLGIKKEHLI
ncbi:MAG: sigma 54-interacting transcriptional regulator [Bacteroidetes bacterium]|nr:sigma 54-interacting transcriptional regulator [Bacteroidota bacterium]